MTRATLTCLACLVVGAAALADQPPQTQPVNIRQTMRSIWRENIAAPTDAPAEDLSRAVRQLQAMVLPKSQAPAATGQSPAPGAGDVDKSVAAETPAVSPTTQPTSQPASQPASKAGVSAADLALLKSMAVEKLTNASGVADALYQAGQYEVAMAVYMRLQDHPPKDVSGDWLLFQVGNCHGRCGNYEQAAALYQKLIAGFPESPWLAVAKVQSQLAAWHQETRPAELLKPAATDG